MLARESVTRWRRRRRREMPAERLPETAHHDDLAAEREDLRRALLALALAPRQRAVVVLRYYEDLSERETAETLGIAVGTVESQARDGLARLRHVLPDLQPEASL